MNVGNALYELSGEKLKKDFAETIDTQVDTVSRWIKGRNNMNMYSVMRICEIYGIELVLRKDGKELVVDEQNGL